MKLIQLVSLMRPPTPCARQPNWLALECVHTWVFSERMSWRYYRYCPVFRSMIALENPIRMCDLRRGPGLLLVGQFGPVSV